MLSAVIANNEIIGNFCKIVISVALMNMQEQALLGHCGVKECVFTMYSTKRLLTLCIGCLQLVYTHFKQPWGKKLSNGNPTR